MSDLANGFERLCYICFDLRPAGGYEACISRARLEQSVGCPTCALAVEICNKFCPEWNKFSWFRTEGQQGEGSSAYGFKDCVILECMKDSGCVDERRIAMHCVPSTVASRASIIILTRCRRD
jgi:hypothetical protein